MWQPRPILGGWTPDQARVAACFPAHRRVVVPAANGVGKTYLAADLVASFIADLPNASVILTAPTNRQVSELLWPHVTTRLLHLDLADEDWIIPTKPKWRGGDGDTLIGFATNTPQRLQGFHAENLLVICDEASGMPSSLIEALDGIAAAEDNYILAIGNPNTPDGAFFAMTRRPSYHVETISALTHPNILTRSELIPGATSWPALVSRLRDWCKETPHPTPESFPLEISDAELQIGFDTAARPRNFLPNDAFRVRYLGVFPLASSWSLIKRDQIRQSFDRSLQYTGIRAAAIDVARTGGDRTIYALRNADTVVSLRTVTASDLMTQAEEAASILRDDDPASVTVDAAGLGIGFIDRLRQLTNVPVIAFQPAGEPTSPLQAKKYFNRRALAYGNLATALEQGAISLPQNDELADELAAMTYRHTDDGRMLIDDKEQIKKKLGRSPDLADCVAILWEQSSTWSATPAAFALPQLDSEEFKW